MNEKSKNQRTFEEEERIKQEVSSTGTSKEEVIRCSKKKKNVVE